MFIYAIILQPTLILHECTAKKAGIKTVKAVRNSAKAKQSPKNELLNKMKNTNKLYTIQAKDIRRQLTILQRVRRLTRRKEYHRFRRHMIRRNQYHQGEY